MANVHQDFASYGSQIYVFKVEINCCLDCPRKLKKCLLDLNGIESVEVDESQNLVTVKGIIDSREIINKLKKMGKIAELVHERKETNSYGYRVELNDEDEEEEEEEEEEKEKDSFNDSFRRKDSSFRHKDSSFRHKNTTYRPNDSSFRARDKNKGSSHAPEKYDNSESNAFSAKEIPDHVCRDKYCTIHKRDNFMPNMNYGASYPAWFRGGLNYNYPTMNSYPPMYGPPPPPPPPPPQYGSQYYGQGMVPPVAGYHARPRQMPRPRADGYSEYFSSDGYSNGCNVM